uniref:type I restriction-modification system subunit M N-terminal domain-containing protein n=1 Tax=Salinivibrio costicola TaxID=51367 RepID=UPI000470F692
MNTENYSQTASFIWSVADLLRGHFKQSQYGRVILPFTLLRRLECVLAPNKQKVLEAAQQHQNKPDTTRELLLLKASGHQFFNASPLSLATLSDTQTAEDLISYVQSFSQSAREIFEHFNFEEFVLKLAEADLLYQSLSNLALKIDLSTDNI